MAFSADTQSSASSNSEVSTDTTATSSASTSTSSRNASDGALQPRRTSASAADTCYCQREDDHFVARNCYECINVALQSGEDVRGRMGLSRSLEPHETRNYVVELILIACVCVL